MPRRLLDLKAVKTSKLVKLVETSTVVGIDARYATLSHCWGPKTSKPPLKTTSDNIANHYKGIYLLITTISMYSANCQSRYPIKRFKSEL